MKTTFQVGDTSPKPGEVGKGSLGEVELADGSRAKVPLINVNGSEDGPILTVVAAVHGNEISAVGAIQRAVKSIDPARLRGALLAIPGANPLAMRNGTYASCLDGTNLSGPWYLPACEFAKASITQRMAWYINEALEKADYAIDLHANPLPSIPFVLTHLNMNKTEELRKQNERIAGAFGVTVIDWPREDASNIMGSCLRAGKPSIVMELAGNIQLWDEVIDVGIRGIRNVMSAIGMIDDEPEEQSSPPLSGDLVFYDWLYAQRAGLMFARKGVGEEIPKGETVAEIRDVYGDVVEEVKMPITGYFWALLGGVGFTSAVSEGEKLAFIFADREELPSDFRWMDEPV